MSVAPILGAILCIVSLAPATTPLRHLVYEVSYATTLTSDTQTTGVPAPPRRLTPSSTFRNYSPEIVREASARRTGTIVIDVVAATGDGGLVVDASLDGSDRKAPTTRIAILRDGTLSYDPNAVVLEEERRLLALLRRDAFDHDLSPGAYWREPIEEKHVKGSTEYRVLGADGSLAQVEITRKFSVSGTNAYDESSRTVTAYDAHMLAPAEATVQLHTRRQTSFTQTVTSDVQIRLKLLEDSFRKTPP